MSTTTPSPSEAPAARDPLPLFRFAIWLHVGLGAEECTEIDESAGENRCGDQGHFHAWCRLPNSLQEEEIRTRALAAKARKVRQLRDSSSDAHEIMEEEFDALLRRGDAARDDLVGELLGADWFRDMYRAMQEVRQIEDPDAGDPDIKLYEHVEDDQARYLRIARMPEAERPTDEYAELQRHLAAYEDAITEAMKSITDPKRQALEALDTATLVEQLRDKRIQNDAVAEFSRVKAIFTWLSCTFREPNGPHSFIGIEQLEAAAPEVIVGLQAVFDDLAQTAQGALGN